MDTYLARPIRADEPFEEIDALCAAAGESGESLPSPPDRQDIINWPAALMALRGDPTLLETVVEAALQEVPGLMAAIGEAVAGGDVAAARLAAHTLRGSIRYFGARPAVQFAQQIETIGDEDGLAGAAKLLPLLEEEIERLVGSLSDYLRATCQSADPPS